MIDTITIKPIKLNEWLPDRCLNGSEPFDPAFYLPESGCQSINFSKENNRESFEQLYKLVINKYDGCGFIAWENDKIIAYHNFFPLEIAQKIKFYGYGPDSIYSDKVLIHNCLTIVKGNYLRKGICSDLVKTSINWAKNNNWKRFEVHFVLPDCKNGWNSDQKSCLSFWEQLGFKIFKEYEAHKQAKEHYGITKCYSMYLSLDNID